MTRRRKRVFVLLVLVPVLLVGAAPARALPIPSKTAADQSLGDREADLTLVRSVLNDEEVLAAFAAHGFSADDVHSRLAQLSPEELHGLAGQIEQMEAAGLQPPRYIWILVAILIGVVILGAIA